MNLSGTLFKLPAVRLVVMILSLALAVVSPGPAGVLFGAIAQTAVINKTNYKSWTLTALEADTTLTFNHGFTLNPPTGSPATGVAPDMIVITPTTSVIALAAGFGISTSSTQITVTKANAVGSAGASPGTTVIAKIVAWRPHSIAE